MVHDAGRGGGVEGASDVLVSDANVTPGFGIVVGLMGLMVVAILNRE